MRKFVILGIIILIGGVLFFMQSKNNSPKQNAQNGTLTVNIPEFTATAQTGETYFNAKCAVCHGKNATGTKNGPPLIHKFYVPNHHGDEAFQRAAKVGVQSHHWKFGNMPPVAGITRAEVAKIIQYVREIQKANGL